MLDKYLIQHSAPTLAGLKTANLFWYTREKEEVLEETLTPWREIFREKGLGLRVMKINGNRALLYVFRTEKLKRELEREKTRTILESQGYDYDTFDEAIEILKSRMEENGSFPHEVGLFLGYPPEDVEGFRLHRGRGCKLCGCWKVYSDVERARRCFRRYGLCRAALCRRLEEVGSLIQMFRAA